jgi:TIR domain
MVDVFISYSNADQQFAEFMHSHLTTEGFSVYLASLAVKPGEKWMPAILENLKSSQWVLCLTSRSACISPWVMQEMGVAIGANKKLVPIVWDQSPNELPAWMRQYQAVDLGHNEATARAAIERIADLIKTDKQRGLLILGLLGAACLLFGGK